MTCPNRPHGEFDPYCEACDGRRAARAAPAPPDIDSTLALDWALRWRGIHPGDACPTCAGAGTRWYSSTATWRGGMGCQRPERDICDRCWGSGETRPWVNLRARRDDEQRRVAEHAVDLLARASGAEFRAVRLQVQALIEALGELADGSERARKPRPGRDMFFVSLVRSLRDVIARAM